MGQIVSAATSTVGSVISGIASSVTDVAGVAAQLSQLAANFSPPAPPAVNATALPKGYAVGLRKSATPGRSVLLTNDDPQQNIGSLIKSTMKAALGNSQSVFAATYVGDTGIRSDYGLVNNYCGTGANAEPSNPAYMAAVTTLKMALSTNFVNWQFPVEDAMLNNMAETMVTEVFTKAGAASSSVGTYSISTNQSIDWVLSYGLFVVTESPSTQALIYAFSAAFNSGF